MAMELNGELVQYRIALEKEHDVDKLKREITLYLKSIVAPMEISISFIVEKDVGSYFLLISVDYLSNKDVYAKVTNNEDKLVSLISSLPIIVSPFSIVSDKIEKVGVERALSFLKGVKDGKFKAENYADFGGKELKVFEKNIGTSINNKQK